MQEKQNELDEEHKRSPYYMRIILEYAIVAKHFCGNWAKNIVMVGLITLLYGAMALKYVAGAESLEQVIS